MPCAALSGPFSYLLSILLFERALSPRVRKDA